jgi:hypothetical protein
LLDQQPGKRLLFQNRVGHQFKDPVKDLHPQTQAMRFSAHCIEKTRAKAGGGRKQLHPASPHCPAARIFSPQYRIGRPGLEPTFLGTAFRLCWWRGYRPLPWTEVPARHLSEPGIAGALAGRPAEGNSFSKLALIGYGETFGA